MGPRACAGDDTMRRWPRQFRHPALLAAIGFCASLAPSAQQKSGDPLPSWHDGPARKAIVGFVERVSRAGSPDFVPVEQRIAVFDNDGTLWAEKPVPFQLMFTFDRVKAMAPQHPEW